eukprot:TRINITY_DN26666_c0_g1_i1.p1 TRINITY_DN26666_c0_g1~~TRINITY_DN26666_c0_g1_i1.p1  ORF type:complete len:439 (+),score=53.56 TRINITY_DN26666_c0_g1_i1:88-1404(+)
MLLRNVAFAIAVAVATQAEGGAAFVPACMVEKCASEILTIGTDEYTRDAVSCVAGNFGPCPGKAWECLGDETCQNAVKCAPTVFDTCKVDIWKIMTTEKERDMLTCSAQCSVGADGHHNPFCVLFKCGFAALRCLFDSTCRHAIECVPQAMLSCSKAAFGCVFGSSGVCSDNVKCLGNGIAQCSAPSVNMLTDKHIADLVTCAHRECPHPQQLPREAGYVGTDDSVVWPSSPAPVDAVTQLVCIQATCPSALPKIILDQDTKDLFSCIGKTDFAPVWKCLGDQQCKQSLSCWAKPLETCSKNVWEVLTDDARRKRMAANVACLRSCRKQHSDDFVDAGLCVLNECSQGLADCAHDEKCSSAVKCFPNMIGDCLVPEMETYQQEPLFRDAIRAFAKGAEFCGQAAIEMLRDEDVADALRCAASCTRKPGITFNVSVSVV